jgi:hypothetical protein
VKGGKSRGLQVGFENEVGRDFVHLFLAFLVTQVCIAKHTVCQSGSVAFIEQSHWQVRDVIQPQGKIAGFGGFLTFPAIAMDGQADHPAHDLVLCNQALKVLCVKIVAAARVGFEGAGPFSAWIANSDADSNGAEIDASNPARFRPFKVSGVWIPQNSQPSEVNLLYKPERSIVATSR